MHSLSAVIIARNEENNIRRCLESVSMADEIIIIDSGSTDRTVEIAESMGARVFSKSWDGFGPAKQEGVSRATGEWILSIDADEIVSPSLVKEIENILNIDSEFSGYSIKRKTNFLGRWIYHCGWYPDYVLRLFKKSKGNFDNALVHEKVILIGRVGYLNGELLHFSYNSLEQYFTKFNRYTTLGAEKAFVQGNTAGWFDVTIRPAASFFKHYITKLGFLDGMEGFIISFLSAASVLTKYAKLREMNKKRDSGERIDD